VRPEYRGTAAIEQSGIEKQKAEIPNPQSAIGDIAGCLLPDAP
jgi:hypothetical protein